LEAAGPTAARVMQRFAELLDGLVFTSSRNAKLRLLEDYFRTTGDPDRGYALAALTDALSFGLPVRRLLGELIEPYADPVLYRLSRDYVGDTAETVSLLWPDHAGSAAAPSLSQVVTELTTRKQDAKRIVAAFLDTLDASGRFALLKLLTGALRAGVSARLAKTALGNFSGRDVSEIEEVWHGVEPPYAGLFAWLEGRGPRPDAIGLPLFRPLMLSHPIEEADRQKLDPQEIVAEWKWDGIRVQVAAQRQDVRLYSRAGDDISVAFPEIVDSFRGRELVADGELLVVADGVARPFNDLQQRLNRKTVTARMLKAYPAHVRLYDMLVLGKEDLRPLPLVERRSRLEAWHRLDPPARTDISVLIEFSSFRELERLWATAREDGVEGLMLKRKSSPYLSGRPKGHWFKWKRAPLTLDCVLMYAQRGSGKRSSYYSDYTFGVWKEGAAGERELVPVGKAYSGFTDEELLRLDRFVRNSTTERFGPVRAVAPALVLEIAFDAVHRSGRHKSGVAMRFPRVHRIRWDKPAAEADDLSTVYSMLTG